MRHVRNSLHLESRLRARRWTRAVIGYDRHVAVRRRLTPLFIAAWIVLLGAIASSPARADQRDARPWRLQAAVGAPDWLQFGLTHRTRIEYLENDFRATAMADVTALSMRTLIAASIILAPISVGVEIQDSRALITEDARVNTTIVNPVDVLRFYASFKRRNMFASGDLIEVELGRLTMDMGSRRLLVRNRYRNTINAFTGGDVRWTSAGNQNVRAFLVVPVTRRPDAVEALAENEIEVDLEKLDTLFGGLYYGGPTLLTGTWLEVFVLGLHERDGDVPTRNRRIVTPGLRLYRKPKPGHVDFQIEAALQVGSSRGTNRGDDREDLSHRAFFAWAELGTTMDIAWQPRIVVHYDYASGDGNPSDERNGRFDSLFGAPIDLGPSGIYGPFSRANLSSPGGRAQIEPMESVSAFAAYRLFWLAERRDAWVRSSGVHDLTGNSGRFLGQQIEGRVRWNILPKNLVLEVGAAHFIRGGFAKHAPGGRDAPASLVFTQLTGEI